MTEPSDPSTGLSPMLQGAIQLYAARAVIRQRLRTEVNKLSKTVEARRQLYTDLRATEIVLTEQLQQIEDELPSTDLAQFRAKYSLEGAP